MASPRVASREGTVLALIGAGHFMSHFWSITLPALFPILRAVFGVDYLQLGVIMTVYGVTNAVCQVPFGYLADRRGAKPILLFGLLLAGGAFMVAAFATSYWFLLVIAIFGGIGQAVFHPADYSILSTMFSEDRVGRAYSMHTFTGFAGSAVAPLVVATLARVFNWQVALFLSGLMGIIIALLVALKLQLPAEALPTPVRERSTSAPQPSVGSSLRIFATQAMLLLFIFFVFTTLFTSGLQSFLPSTLTERYDVSFEAANGVLTAFLTTLAVGVLAGGFLADRIHNYSRVIAVTFTASTLLMFLVALVPMPIWLLFIVFGVAGGLQGIIMPSRDKMVREISPEGAAGKSFAFVSVGMSVGGMIAPPVMGAVLSRNEPTLVFWALALFLLVAAVTVLLPSRVGEPAAQERAHRQASA